MTRQNNTAELKQVITYIDTQTYNKIEAARGIYSRSSFVATVLMDVFSEIPKPEKQEVV
ncbi:hypothetical protein [Methanosarcina mazei]|uniref:hypothetical protein n=1 Tax=Methanosarcina mazei TaxID=2209 RepID=UPI000AA737FA|nr:hypothetical protein [Methanosarcina mazei]